MVRRVGSGCSSPSGHSPILHPVKHPNRAIGARAVSRSVHRDEGPHRFAACENLFVALSGIGGWTCYACFSDLRDLRGCPPEFFLKLLRFLSVLPFFSMAAARVCFIAAASRVAPGAALFSGPWES